MRPLVKEQIIVERPEQIVSAIGNATMAARTEPPGPIHVLIPYDFFGKSAPMMEERLIPAPRNVSEISHEPDAAALDDALTLLQDARAPLIYAGHGVVR